MLPFLPMAACARTPNVNGGNVSELTRNKIDYFVVCVNDFADTYGMSYVAALDYLKAYKGLEFLSEHYDVEHTYSVEEAVADLAQVCARNGGVVA